ncbi:MAG: S9 family peptidase, partial [Gammaproteobacteria bacterium]|nr:S9 family peptidase [Gammaproteobacteria bacterium]
MKRSIWLQLGCLALLAPFLAAAGESPAPFDAAKAFGARPSVISVKLSPDGNSVMYIATVGAQGAVAYTLGLAKGAAPQRALSADGKQYRLDDCHWVSNQRLVCLVDFDKKDPIYGPMRATRLFAVDRDGANVRELSNQVNAHTAGFNLYGGNVIDWLPNEDGAVLMVRNYLPERRQNTRMIAEAEGLGVDWVDTRTLAVKHVEPARREAEGYLSDGRGNVRIMLTGTHHKDGENTGLVTTLYRLQGSREWRTLGTYNEKQESGFEPYAVDHDLNVVYGLKKTDGRKALYRIKLDETLQEELVYARPDVDVDRLVRIGRRGRVVGTTFVREGREAKFFAPDIESMITSLSRAVPNSVLNVIDASVDEQKLLVLSRADRDPGVYYIFDRAARQLNTFVVARGPLEGVALASQKAVTYPAADGTPIPAYLTLPPGREDARGLPALV